MSAPRPPSLGDGWGTRASNLRAEVGEGICQGCGGAGSRAAREWNEKAVKWQRECLWEMERKTLPWWEGVRWSLRPGLRALGTPSPAPGVIPPHWSRSGASAVTSA